MSKIFLFKIECNTGKPTKNPYTINNAKPIKALYGGKKV